MKLLNGIDGYASSNYPCVYRNRLYFAFMLLPFFVFSTYLKVSQPALLQGSPALKIVLTSLASFAVLTFMFWYWLCFRQTKCERMHSRFGSPDVFATMFFCFLLQDIFFNLVAVNLLVAACLVFLTTVQLFGWPRALTGLVLTLAVGSIISVALKAVSDHALDIIRAVSAMPAIDYISAITSAIVSMNSAISATMTIIVFAFVFYMTAMAPLASALWCQTRMPGDEYSTIFVFYVCAVFSVLIVSAGFIIELSHPDWLGYKHLASIIFPSLVIIGFGVTVGLVTAVAKRLLVLPQPRAARQQRTYWARRRFAAFVADQLDGYTSRNAPGIFQLRLYIPIGLLPVVIAWGYAGQLFVGNFYNDVVWLILMAPGIAGMLIWFRLIFRNPPCSNGSSRQKPFLYVCAIVGGCAIAGAPLLMILSWPPDVMVALVDKKTAAISEGKVVDWFASLFVAISIGALLAIVVKRLGYKAAIVGLILCLACPIFIAAVFDTAPKLVKFILFLQLVILMTIPMLRSLVSLRETWGYRISAAAVFYLLLLLVPIVSGDAWRFIAKGSIGDLSRLAKPVEFYVTIALVPLLVELVDRLSARMMLIPRR